METLDEVSFARGLLQRRRFAIPRKGNHTCAAFSHTQGQKRASRTTRCEVCFSLESGHYNAKLCAAAKCD